MLLICLEEDMCLYCPNARRGGEFEWLKTLQGSQPENCRKELSLGVRNHKKKKKIKQHLHHHMLFGKVSRKNLEKKMLSSKGVKKYPICTMKYTSFFFKPFPPSRSIGHRQLFSSVRGPGQFSPALSRCTPSLWCLPPSLFSRCFLVSPFFSCLVDSTSGPVWWCLYLVFARCALSISTSSSWFLVLQEAGLSSAINRSF